MKLFLAGVVFICGLGLVATLEVNAHNYGSFYEEVVGPYLVDIGYDPPEPVSGGRLLFDLNLFDAAAPTEPVAFDSAWVRLEYGGELLLAGPIAKMPLGPTTLIMRMPERAGELLVHARFERDGEALAEVSFPIVVTQPQGQSNLLYWVLGGLGVFALGLFFYRRRVAA